MPVDYGRRLHDRQHVCPSRPSARQDDPERTVDGTEPMPGSVSVQGRQLLTECQVLGDEARPRAESRDERADDGLDQRQHHSRIATQALLSPANRSRGSDTLVGRRLTLA